MADAAGDASHDPVRTARALLFAERHGVLSTISVHRAGYPYGSLTPYALSARGTPIVLISTLAAHTRNLIADGRACLFVGEHPGGDEPANPQAAGRVSLLGRAARVPATGEADARARYLSRIPDAESYFQTHDFQLWELAVEEARLIAGFGKIGWVDGATIMRDPLQDPLRADADGICAHMNNDHADALRTFCQARRTDPANARMVGVDTLGFDIETPAARLRFDFPRALSTPDEVRVEIIGLLRAARAQVG
jgi:putative heme iron utilization protein